MQACTQGIQAKQAEKDSADSMHAPCAGEASVVDWAKQANTGERVENSSKDSGQNLTSAAQRIKQSFRQLTPNIATHFLISTAYFLALRIGPARRAKNYYFLTSCYLTQSLPLVLIRTGP